MWEMEDQSVDLVKTDPPFNISFSSYVGLVKDSGTPEGYARWTVQWLEKCLRVLKPGGQVYALMPRNWMPWWLPLGKDFKWRILTWGKTNCVLQREQTYLVASAIGAF